LVLGEVDDDRLTEGGGRDRGLDRSDRDLDRFGALPQGLEEPVGGRPDRQLPAAVRPTRHELAVDEREAGVDRGERYLVERLLDERLDLAPGLAEPQAERHADRPAP